MIVADASVVASALLPQDLNQAVSRRWLERWVASNRPLIEPTTLLAEVAGAVARRTGRLAARRAVAEVRRLPTLRLIAVDDELGHAAAQLAADLRLRGADAVYVAVADRLGIPLVTWDREQVERAGGAVAVRTPDDREVQPAPS